VKAFLSPSGVPEFGHLDAEALRLALLATARAGVPLVVHAEWPAVLETAPPVAGRSYASWVASRPPEAETAAVELLLAAAARADAHAHVLHLSAAGALPLLERARSRGVRLTAETCPHYLSLAAEDLPDGATPAKCAPPVRGRDNREELWDGVRAGLLAAVVSDHSPAPPELKAVESGDMAAAWGGVSGLQTQLPVVWTAARGRGVGLADLARLQSAQPASLAGLPDKGAIEVGRDADLVAWDPDATFVVDPSALHHRHPLSPWAGHELYGVVHTTWLRGRPVDVGGRPHGRLLGRAG
jgi:allantoinase